MKSKFSKILGVGLTLSLLVSLLLTAAPVLADDVTDVSVTIADKTISKATDYTIQFKTHDKLTAATDSVVIVFPEDTDASGLEGSDIEVKIRSSVGTWAGTLNPWTCVTDATTATRIVVGTDKITVTIKLADLAQNIEEGAWVEITTAAAAGQVAAPVVVNPSDIGDYSLTVATNVDTTAVESPTYTTTAPVVGGFVYVYNPANILLATYGGSAALNDADTAGDLDQEGYTIKVGPGTYTLNADLTIGGKGVILESSEGAADTIIDANTHDITIVALGEDVVIDGFTIDDAGTAISIEKDDAVVKNCVITDATTAGITIVATGTDATVENNVIEDCATGILFAAGGVTDLLDVDITGNTITEANTLGGIVFGGGEKNVDITGNTIIGNEVSGITFATTVAAVCEDILISGNTISGNDPHGIYIDTTVAPTKLVIRENVIINNETDGILIDTWTLLSDYIMFNNIHGNDDDNVDNDAGADVNAYFNWWGSAVKDDITGELEGTVNYDPWLVDAQEAVASGSNVAVDDVSSLDAKTAAGVKVSGMADDTPIGADIISAAKYVANPQGAIDDAIGFYDVYVNLDTIVAAATLGQVSAKLKFYDTAITSTSTVSFWTGDFWAECSDITARDGLVWVTVTEDTTPGLEELEGTPFVVVAGPPVEDVLAVPAIAAPTSGADDVILQPTLAWGTVVDALGYDFELADNPLFVMPIVSRTGDLGRLITPFYQQAAELDYSTYYYWRVRAVSADAESVWSSAVFMTVAEVPPEPEVWMSDDGLTFDSREELEKYLAERTAAEEPADIIIESPDIIVESPDVIVPLPAETPITPAWIYVIIGVGAVLVIALIVLIVRTRRVA